MSIVDISQHHNVHSLFQYNVTINISWFSYCTSLPICVCISVLIPLSLSLFFRRMFGNLTELRGDKYAVAIDSAPPDVFVIIHIYDEVRTLTLTLLLLLLLIYCLVLYHMCQAEQMSC